MLDKRSYSRGEVPPHVFNNFQGVNKFNRYFYIHVGEILEVDIARYRMKIRWLTSRGSPEWMPISFAYAGPAGFLGIIPEEHALGIFGFYDQGDGHGIPLLLSYLPAGLDIGLNYNNLKLKPDSISTEDERTIQYRFRKLRPGELMMSSPFGGQILTADSVEISDNMQDSIILRYFDQSIISNSINNFMFADGVSVRAGLAIRNSMNLFNSDGSRIEGINGRETSLWGREVIYIVPFGQRIEYDTQFYSEYRIDVDEIADNVLDSNDITGTGALSTRNPIVSLVMGNYIGANDKNQNYGQILRPVLFGSRDDINGNFSLVQCVQNKGLDEVTTLGLAYALHSLKSGTFIGIDKEGHYYMNLSGSIANPLGGGRSMSILAQGNLKEVWGQAAEDGNSWDLTAKGGIVWNIGQHNPRKLSRSIDIKTDSGIYIEAGSADEEGRARQDISYGDAYEYVNGTKTEVITDTHDITISGLREEHIMGSASSKYDVDKAVNVQGVFSEVAVKEKQCRFGRRKTAITNGNDELEITKGDLTEDIKFGNRKTSIITGNIEQTITAGNYKTSIVKGDYEVSVGVGNVTIKTGIGDINISAKKNIEISALIKAVFKGLKTELGTSPGGGVVIGAGTTPSHFDYVTGSPLKGALTVSAGP